MSRRLDREGIFKAQPLSFGIKPSPQSQALAVVIDFKILAQLDGASWVSWHEYEEHTVTAYFYVVKKDGTVNTQVVDQLAASLGWAGELEFEVPFCSVQITTRFETNDKGQQQLKVGWINHGDFTPTAQTATPEEVRGFESRFGSLLRAAATAKPKIAPAEILPF